MKLLQVIGGGDVGGAETFFVRLALAFRRAGLDQRLVMRANDARERRLRDGGLEPVIAPFGGALDRRTASAVAAEIDAFGPDAVLSWMNRASRFAAAGRRRAIRRPPLFARLIARPGGSCNARDYHGCDWLIGDTPDVADRMSRSGWPPERIRFVPDFVDAEPGTPIGRTWLGVPEGVPLLLAAGPLHPDAGIDVLLTALKRIDGAHLLLAGDGEQGRDLEVLAHKLMVADRVRFLGGREDVADLMASADMLVFPSRIEPFGNFVVEAWARGLPVVAAASAGPHWLIEDGVNGLLAPLGDAAALAGAIRRLLADPALGGRLAVAGRARFLADFTEAAVTERYTTLFDEAAA